jgi:glycosyltransferase involved in cell wall biosynthesis
MKKNILMVGTYPPNQTGGGEFQLQTLSKMLTKKGYGVSVLSMGTNKNFKFYDDGIKIYRISKFEKNRRGTLRLLQILKYITVEIFNPLMFIFTIYLILKNRIRTVHITTYNQISLAPIIASKILMRKVIVTMHAHELLCSHSSIMPFCYGPEKGKCGDCMSRYHRLPKKLNRLKPILLPLYNSFTSLIISLKLQLTNFLANAIVFPSDYSKKIHVKYGVNKKKSIVISCFLDDSELRVKNTNELKKRLGLRGKRVILYVGKTIEEKGIKVLIQSLREVLKSNKKFKLIVIGRGWSFHKMKILSQQLKIDKYVKFVGSVPHSAIFSYYHISDIVVIPSIVPETFSIALLEASLSKKIIICSRIGALEERIYENKNGFLVEPNNPEELAKKIVFVLNNYKKLMHVGEKAYIDVKFKYNFNRSFLKYLKLIEDD